MAAQNGNEAEDRVIQALVKVAKLVKEGSSPNDALVTIAKADQLPPGLIKLAINAYNTGRTNEVRKTGNDLFDKSADFEVADPIKIIEAIYPSNVKTAAALYRETAVSDEYSSPPDFARIRERVKLASQSLPEEPAAPAYKRDPDRFDRKIRGALEKIATQREEYSRELDNLWDKVAGAIMDLQRYFKTPGCDAVEDVLPNVEAAFGKAAGVMVKKAAGCCDDKKPMKIRRPVSRMYKSKSPYKEVEAGIKAAEAYNQKLAEASAFEESSVNTEFRLGRALSEQTGPIDPDYNLSMVRRLNGEKRAFSSHMVGPISAGMQFALGGSMMNALTPDSTSKLKQDAYTDLLDPVHEHKLKAVRTKAILHGLLNSPYFEGEDPNKISELFNNISTLTPRAASQPMLLESQMRQLMAQGQSDPHSLKQMLGIEKDLKDRDALPTGAPGMLQVLNPSLGGGGGGGGNREKE